MLLSYKHKLIFLHCRKTGGSSVRTSLYRFLGPRDIALGAWEDAFQFGVRAILRSLWWSMRPPGCGVMLNRIAHKVGSKRPPFVKKHCAVRQEVSKGFNKAVKRTSRSIYGLGSAHVTAARVREEFPEEWETFYSFTVARDPFDCAASYYLWKNRKRSGDSRPTFAQYLRTLLDAYETKGKIPGFVNWPIYTIDDKIAVNRVVLFEDLTSGLAAAMEEAGLDWDGWLPRAKPSKSRSHYRDMYGPEEKDFVQRMAAKEIEAFGYEF
jgi:hypothetical protein